MSSLKEVYFELGGNPTVPLENVTPKNNDYSRARMLRRLGPKGEMMR